MMPQRAVGPDAAELADLDAVCFEARERWTQGLWADELTAQDLDERCVLVQRDGSVIRAAATFSQVADMADLLRVMVHPAARGLGLAQQLVHAGAEWALGRGADRMLLEVRHDNVDALGLYQRLGFEHIDHRRDYYGAGLHADVMQAALPLHIGGSRTGGTHE